MRIRTVKPGFWTDERMAALPHATRLLAIALLNVADDEGYFLANPALVRGAVFPFDDDSTAVRRGLDELSEIGFIRLGVDGDGRAVGHVANFLKHQKIDRPNPSRIRVTARFADDSSNRCRAIDEPSSPEMEREGKGNQEAEPCVTGGAHSCDLLSVEGSDLPLVPSGTDFPFSSVAFAEAWHGFTESRRSAKRPLTPRAGRLLLARLGNWPEEKAIRALNLSTESGWQCVVDPDLRGTGKVSSNRATAPSACDHAAGF